MIFPPVTGAKQFIETGGGLYAAYSSKTITKIGVDVNFLLSRKVHTHEMAYSYGLRIFYSFSDVYAP